MNTHLVLVADHASARVFRVPGLEADLDELIRLENPAGHGHERDLGSSAPGRGVGGGEGRRTAFESAHTLREHATELFVRKIARELAPLLTREPAAQLVLVAGPEMLGALRGHLDLAGESRLEWPHNLANLPTPDLRRRLRTAVAELRQTNG